MTPYPGAAAKNLESGLRIVSDGPELSLRRAWTRYPGRWGAETLVAATRVQGIFDGLSVADCVGVLDRIERVRLSLRR